MSKSFSDLSAKFVEEANVTIKSDDIKTTAEACEVIYDALGVKDSELLFRASIAIGLEKYITDLIKCNLAAFLVTNSIKNTTGMLENNGFPPMDALINRNLSKPILPVASRQVSLEIQQVELDEPKSVESTTNELKIKELKTKLVKPNTKVSKIVVIDTKVEKLKSKIEKPKADEPKSKVEKPKADEPKAGWKTISKPEKTSIKQAWADIETEEEIEKKIKQSLADTPTEKKKFNELKASLSWSARARFTGETLAELKLFISSEQLKEKELKEKQLKEKELKEKEELEEKQLKEKEELKEKEDLKIKINTPIKKQPISEQIKEQTNTPISKLVKPVKKDPRYVSIPPVLYKKEDEEKIDDGFTLVLNKKSSSQKLLSITPQKPNSKLTTANQQPEKAKTATSAKWFLTNGGILSEKQDWHLWDYDRETGNPIRWYQINETQWKINKNSQFIHTKHPDGTWTTQEEITYQDEEGKWKYSLTDVTVAYLTWVLTPPGLRRGSCPAY